MLMILDGTYSGRALVSIRYDGTEYSVQRIVFREQAMGYGDNLIVWLFLLSGGRGGGGFPWTWISTE